MTDYIMVCPKCKSPDVYRDTSSKLTGAMGLPSVYVCNTCMHSGPVFPEVEKSELKSFEEMAEKMGIKDKSKDSSEIVDTSYGKGIVKGYWKIIGPLAILFGLIFLISKGRIYGIILLVLGGSITYLSYRK